MRLRRHPRLPSVGGNRILPEVLLLCCGAAGSYVAFCDSEYLVIGGHGIAVWPITTVQDAVFAEELPELIELWFICHLIQRNLRTDATNDLRSFHEHLRS